jgi:hypothetical protein
VDGSVLLDVLDLWCGRMHATDKSLTDALLLGSVADRFEVVEVVTALEEAIAAHLRVGVCEEAAGRQLCANAPVGEKAKEAGALLEPAYEEVAASCSELAAELDPAASSDGTVRLLCKTCHPLSSN